MKLMDTTKQIALVTGANKGIGFETARQLAQLGFIVWLGCRDHERGESAAKELAEYGDVRLVSLDVTNPESVRAAAVRIFRKFILNMVEIYEKKVTGHWK